MIIPAMYDIHSCDYYSYGYTVGVVSRIRWSSKKKLAEKNIHAMPMTSALFIVITITGWCTDDGMPYWNKVDRNDWSANCELCVECGTKTCSNNKGTIRCVVMMVQSEHGWGLAQCQLRTAFVGARAGPCLHKCVEFLLATVPSVNDRHILVPYNVHCPYNGMLTAALRAHYTSIALHARIVASALRSTMPSTMCARALAARSAPIQTLATNATARNRLDPRRALRK